MKIIFSFIFSVLACSLFATDFHVVTSGSDDNDGGLANPWKSIQHAMEEATSGSTVFIHEGMYNEPLYLEVSGSAGSEIRFTSFENDLVIVDGSNFTSSALLEIFDKSHVTIEGITFQNFEKNDAIGILIEGKCVGISIIGCIIKNINFSSDPNSTISENTNSQPLIVYGTEADQAIDNLKIKGNTIYDCRTGYSEALAINGNVTNFLVENNEVFNISNIGIDIIGHEGTCSDPSKDQARNGIIIGNKTYNCKSPYATAAGIYVDGGASLIIERNEVYDNQWGIEIGCENIGKTAGEIIVRNNFIYGNQTAGLQLGGYDYPSGSGKVENIQIVNNTFFGNDLENDGTGEIYLSYNENLKFYNNIVTTTNSEGVVLSTEDLSVQSVNVEFEFNNWHNSVDGSSGSFYYEKKDYDNLAAIQSGESAFAGNLSMNPSFVSSDDLHLQEFSPMIDAGYSGADIDSGEKDFNGDARNVGGKVDIGAEEYGGSVSSLFEEVLKVNFSIFPNPASEYILIQKTRNVRNSEVRIYDVIGRLKLSSVSVNERIDISSLDVGQYLLNLVNEKGIIGVKKLVIAR